MFKILGIILILCSTTSFGLYKKFQFQKRVKNLEKSIFMLKIMERELGFNCPKTLELIKLLSKKLETPLDKIFFEMYQNTKNSNLHKIDDIWRESFEKFADLACFSKEDIEILSNISSILGKYDANEQIISLNYFEKLLEENLILAKKISNDNGNITQTVAICIGIIISIILI